MHLLASAPRDESRLLAGARAAVNPEPPPLVSAGQCRPIQGPWCCTNSRESTIDNRRLVCCTADWQKLVARGADRIGAQIHLVTLRTHSQQPQQAVGLTHANTYTCLPAAAAARRPHTRSPRLLVVAVQPQAARTCWVPDRHQHPWVQAIGSSVCCCSGTVTCLTCRTEMPTADQEIPPLLPSARMILTLPLMVPVKLAMRVALIIQVICACSRTHATKQKSQVLVRRPALCCDGMRVCDTAAARLATSRGVVLPGARPSCQGSIWQCPPCAAVANLYSIAAGLHSFADAAAMHA